MNGWDALDTAIKVIAPSAITAWVALWISRRSRASDANKEAVRRRHEVLEVVAQEFEEHQTAMKVAGIAAGFLPHTGPPESRIVHPEDEKTQKRTFAALLEVESRLMKTATRLHLHRLVGCEGVLAEYLIASAKFRDSEEGPQREERRTIWDECGKHLLETITRTYDELFSALGAKRGLLLGRYGSDRDSSYLLDPKR
jgi:hypothetical protein